MSGVAKGTDAQLQLPNQVDLVGRRRWRTHALSHKQYSYKCTRTRAHALSLCTHALSLSLSLSASLYPRLVLLSYLFTLLWRARRVQGMSRDEVSGIEQPRLYSPAVSIGEPPLSLSLLLLLLLLLLHPQFLILSPTHSLTVWCRSPLDCCFGSLVATLVAPVCLNERVQRGNP